MTDTHHWGYPPTRPPYMVGLWFQISRLHDIVSCHLRALKRWELGVCLQGNRSLLQRWVSSRCGAASPCPSDAERNHDGGRKLTISSAQRATINRKSTVGYSLYVQWWCVHLFYVASFDHVGFMILDTLNSIHLKSHTNWWFFLMSNEGLHW